MLSTLNYIEHFLAFVFTITVCISISTFASLVDISKEIMSSTIRLNICGTTARIKKYKSIIKKKKKKHDEIVLLAKPNLDCIKSLISRPLTDSFIEHDYLLLINMLREYDYIKEKVNKLETS